MLIATMMEDFQQLIGLILLVICMVLWQAKKVAAGAVKQAATRENAAFLKDLFFKK
jgi:hypothetical protein